MLRPGHSARIAPAGITQADAATEKSASPCRINTPKRRLADAKPWFKQTSPETLPPVGFHRTKRYASRGAPGSKRAIRGVQRLTRLSTPTLPKLYNATWARARSGRLGPRVPLCCTWTSGAPRAIRGRFGRASTWCRNTEARQGPQGCGTPAPRASVAPPGARRRVAIPFPSSQTKKPVQT